MQEIYRYNDVNRMTYITDIMNEGSGMRSLSVLLRACTGFDRSAEDGEAIRGL